METVKKNIKKEGSAILVTMILTFVISIMVAGAIRMVAHEFQFSAQSANWAQCLHTAEAGIEVALAALQQTVDGTYAWSSAGCGWAGSVATDIWTMNAADLNPAGHNYPNSDYMMTLLPQTL
jgi:type II secretory pathway component PulK